MPKLKIARIITQSSFFALFVYFVFTTEYHFTPGKERVSGWLKFFFDINPLNLIGTSLAGGVLYSTLIFGFVLVVLSIFFGRFFCGWICPLGTVNHFFSSFKSERKRHRGLALMKSNIYKSYQGLKYYILIALAGMAVVGSLQLGLLDPISTLSRSVGMVILPAITLWLKTFVGWLWSSDIGPISLLGEGLYRISVKLFLPFRQPHYNGIFWLAFIFVTIVVANRIYTRFWCRALCPLGALLGLLSSFSIFGLQKNYDACDACDKCLLHCQGGDNPHKDLPHHRSECHLCLNCLHDCPQGALSFVFFPRREKAKIKPQITRRKIIFTGLAGLLAVPTLRSGLDSKARTRPKLIRPPGSLAEEDFLARCIRCGQCMKICPTNALHPTLLDAGWEGIFTPLLIPTVGYCEYNCILCGHSCPTGAIEPLTLERKIGAEEIPAISIGTAFIDRGRCLPWAFDKECIVCEEWCPTSPKAIRLETIEQVLPEGNTISLRRPYVIAELCIGCGACEYACPVEGQRAIYVNSVGETRNPDNEMLMHRPAKTEKAE